MTWWPQHYATLCHPYLVTHRTPGTRQQESGWYQCSSRLDPRPGAGLPVAMGPAISGCIYLRVFPWSVQYSTVQYSTWSVQSGLATVCGLVTVVAVVPVTVRREPARPVQPATGRGIPSNTHTHCSTQCVLHTL